MLKKPEWQEKRKRILKRDGYKCRYCSSKTNLHVHHKFYLRYPDNTKALPWDYPDDVLITLCYNCHKKVHQSKKIKFYYTSRKYKISDIKFIKR